MPLKVLQEASFTYVSQYLSLCMLTYFNCSCSAADVQKPWATTLKSETRSCSKGRGSKSKNSGHVSALEENINVHKFTLHSKFHAHFSRPTYTHLHLYSEQYIYSPHLHLYSEQYIYSPRKITALVLVSKIGKAQTLQPLHL